MLSACYTYAVVIVRMLAPPIGEAIHFKNPKGVIP
jgi:hypothetical protein